MSNLRNKGQPIQGSAIYEPVGAIAKRGTLPDNYLQQISRHRTQTLIYDLKSYIKR